MTLNHEESALDKSFKEFKGHYINRNYILLLLLIIIFFIY